MEISQSFHKVTAYKLVELFLICFLNGNSVKRKDLENYLLKGEKNKRVGFKDVYQPLIKTLELPITEKTLHNKSRGRYNPIIWELDVDLLVDEFVENYLEYLEEKNLSITESSDLLKERILTAISTYQEYWQKEIEILMTYASNFPLPITALITQTALLDDGNSKLIKFLPIYLSLSFENGRIEESSGEPVDRENRWAKAISNVPSYLDMSTFYYSLLINEWVKIWPNQLDLSPEHLLAKSKEKIFKDQADILYRVFKDRINKREEINFLFSPAVPRDESLWLLFFSVQESYMKNLYKDDDERSSRFIQDLRITNQPEYNKRVDLFLKIVFNSFLRIFDEKFDFNSAKYVFLAEERQSGEQKVLFNVKNPDIE